MKSRPRIERFESGESRPPAEKEFDEISNPCDLEIRFSLLITERSLLPGRSARSNLDDSTNS